MGYQCMAIRNRVKELVDRMNKTRYQFWKETGLAQNTAYRLYDDPTYVPGPSVMDKISQQYDVQPGDYLVFVREDGSKIAAEQQEPLEPQQGTSQNDASSSRQQRPLSRLAVIPEVAESA